MNHEPERQKLLSLLERYGRNLHSFMVLEPGLSIWLAEDAAVAYVRRGGYWVAVGGPLCAAERLQEVACEFRKAAAQDGRRVVFFGVTQPLVDQLRELDFDFMQVGLAPQWSPAQWPQVIAKAGKLRNRLSKARRDGIQVRKLSASEVETDARVRERFAAIADAWSSSKALPPMGFMVTVELFQHAERRRYFVAEHARRICGFAVCIPVYGRNGWLLEDMILEPGAPAGCSEALVDLVMQQLAAEQAEFVSLGMVALAGINSSTNQTRHRSLAWLLRICSHTMGWLYNFEGLYRFRNKMQPTSWEPIYVVAGTRINFFTIRAILMAFAQGWVPRFGIRVLGHWIKRRRPTAAHSVAAISSNASKPIVDWKTLLLAVAAIATMLLAIIGGRLGMLGPWITLLLGTLAAYTAFTPVHEAVHGNVSKYPVVNGVVGHLCSATLLGAYHPYRYLHMQHHVHTNHAPQDPDYWCAVGPAWSWPLRWATQDLGYLTFYWRNWRQRPLFERCNLLFCFVLYVAIAGVTLVGYPALFIALLLGWFLPARIAMFLLAATFSWMPHAPHQERDPFRATTVHSSSWLTWVLLGQNFHLLHHLHPRIPFYRLSRSWMELGAEIKEQGGIDRREKGIEKQELGCPE